MMSLDEKEWGEFKIEDLFEVYTGTDLILGKITEGNIPVISHTALNNGVACWSDRINNRKLFSHNRTISLADRGNFKAFVQASDFYIGTRVKALEFKKDISKNILSFIANQINKQDVRFSYGYNATDNVGNIIVLLPINNEGKPNWEYMEEYAKELERQKLQKYLRLLVGKVKSLEYVEIDKLEEKQWEEFIIEDLFNTKIGKSIDGNKVDKNSGSTAYITRREVNNALDGFIDYDDPEYLNDSFPVITIGNETATPFVQPYAFFTGTKVNILNPKEDISEFALHFISTSLRQHKNKYNYSFTVNSTRLKKQKILLPINDEGKPDYEYMEQFVINMMLEKYNKYINYISKRLS